MTILGSFILGLLISSVICETEEETLRRGLMDGYNPMAFPPRPVQLSFGFKLLHINMNEKTHTLETDLWLTMRWNDTRLTWTDTQNFELMHFRPKAVWRPDITLYNNAEPLLMENYGISHILNYPNGSMLWVPPAQAKAYCAMDMTYWPYDTHKCVQKYGSWTHHALRLNLIIGQGEDFAIEEIGGHVTESNVSRSEWILLSHSVTRDEKTYDCCVEPYVSVNLELVVKRDSEAYAWTVQCPIAALCLLTVVVFLLPPSSGEKITLGSVALLTNFYFLVSVSEMIGHASNHTPLIVKLLSKQLLITTSSLVVSAMIYRIIKSPHGRPLPGFLKDILTSIAPLLCLGGYSDMVKFPASSNNPEDVELNSSPEGSKSKKNPNNATWILFAAVVDRICLIVFFIIFIVLMIQFSKVL